MLVGTGLHSPLFAIKSIFVRNLLQALSIDNRSRVHDSGKVDNERPKRSPVPRPLRVQCRKFCEQESNLRATKPVNPSVVRLVISCFSLSVTTLARLML